MQFNPDAFSSANFTPTLRPMNTEVKQINVGNQRRRDSQPNESIRLEKLGDGEEEAKPDTNKNMLAIFEIMRQQKSARLENLVLNVNSFAQTVENIFALSFLVKDSRVEILFKKCGHHLVFKCLNFFQSFFHIRMFILSLSSVVAYVVINITLNPIK